MDTSETISTLGVSLFIFGLGIGPLFLSPISEFYGRRPVYVTALTLYCLFQLITVLGGKIELLLIGRFLTGFAGSAFMTVISGSFNDLFEKKDMRIPTLMFSLGPFIGPGIGPLLGAVINAHLGYRWIFRIMLLWSVSLLMTVGILVPETYESILLKNRAKKLRKKRPGYNYRAPVELIEKESICKTAMLSAKRPLQMLFMDPVIFITSFYAGILLAFI